jgi:high-affinity nickel-transport protein
LFLPLIFTCGTAFAHPIGNFSVNHYSKIKVGQKTIDILYLIDMAEIPTYQEMRASGFSANAADANLEQYLILQANAFKGGLILEIDEKPVPLQTISHQVFFADGAGGLPTMRMGFLFRGNVSTASEGHRLAYHDNNFPGRAGWKEIVAVADGSHILESSAPAVDRSSELTNYSSDVLNSPPQQVSAAVHYEIPKLEPDRPASVQLKPAVASRHEPHSSVIGSRSFHPAGVRSRSATLINSGRANVNPLPVPDTAHSGTPMPASLPLTSHRQNTPRSRFTDLIAVRGNLGFWFLFSAALVAAGLGALHALEPGHGKTIVAAYLVGSRGTARHAVLLGILVTASHTAGVYILGAVTLYASRYIVPERLYPWLGAISGLSVVILGVFIFLRHLTGETGEHSHVAGEKHSHWFLSMFQRGKTDQSLEAPARPSTIKSTARVLSLRELCLLGITGGIVPCPAALVVLLSAFSLHRIGFGLFLITSFSFGLAAVLVAVGLIMVYAKHHLSKGIRERGSFARYLPLFSSAFMVLLGAGITISALGSGALWQGMFTKEKFLPFVTVVLLGLFLGMRHSTDPDHVVAVSTIVSRQRSIKSSAMIGLLWGLGHTLTIFIVGSAIIIFGVVIPPRLGLSMEFCVALMLVLLGLLNLTGALKWLTERLTPANPAAAWQLPVPAKNRFAGFLQPAANLGLYQTIRPLVIGLVHGLAGSAAVALLVLSTIKSPLWATAYLLVFGFGTMAGMMIMTTAISAPLVFSGKKFFTLSGHLTTASGLISVAFGLFLVYHIGIIDGLFTLQPHWIPQ